MISLKELQRMVHQTAREKGWWPLRSTEGMNNIYDDDTVNTTSSQYIDINKTRVVLEEVNIPEKLMLMVSELGEALEFYREDVGMEGIVWKLEATGQWITQDDRNNSQTFDDYIREGNKKPDGFWIELVDVMIRILDLAGAYDINMEYLIKEKHEYNKTRPYRHGGKKC